MKQLLLFIKEIQSVHWLRIAVYGGLIAAVYWTTLRWMVLKDWMREDYSHCAIIPFVVLYLLWEKRKVLAAIPSVPSWLGLVPFGVGVVLFWMGELGGELFTLYMSLWFVIVGLTWLHLGWAKIKVIWFALIMMLAMFPFPIFINVRLSLYLKMISSQLGVWMLQLYGMSAYREGNVIDLGFTQLQVVDACNGLRYLFPLMVLALILAYWFKDRFWKRAVLFLSSIPIAILVNSFRIALTGVLYSFWGPNVAEGFFHGFSGWLIFLFTLGMLLAEMWVLKKVQGSGFKVQGENTTEAQGLRSKVQGEGKTAVQGSRFNVQSSRDKVQGRSDNRLLQNCGFRGLFQLQFLVAVVILLLTLGISQGVEFREKIPIKQSLSLFPTQIGEWTGVPEPMEREFVERLQFSDYVIMNYRDRQGRNVNFYTAYYESQRKGESIHSPETCLPGSGWEFREAGAMAIPMRGGASMKVNRAFMEKNDTRQLTYYWFAQRGRVLTNLYELKIYAFWDALIRQRTDGALVRIITPVYPNEEVKDAEARLQGFTREVVPVLDGYIPK